MHKYYEESKQIWITADVRQMVWKMLNPFHNLYSSYINTIFYKCLCKHKLLFLFIYFNLKLNHNTFYPILE